MPNWVATVVEFIGDDKDVQAVFKEISNEETGFDFNKLIPMPESLNVKAGSEPDLAYAYYSIKKFNRLPSELSWLISPEDVIRRVEKNICTSPQKLFKMGKVLHENKEKYGATTWYDWCIKNWGTKWNACEVQVSDHTIEFSTAWSFAEPVMRKLAELCAKHSVDFEGEWSDENMGYNTGYFESFEGVLFCEYNQDNSNEAFAAYVRCNGESNCLDVDASGNYHRHECDESCPNYKECR